MEKKNENTITEEPKTDQKKATEKAEKPNQKQKGNKKSSKTKKESSSSEIDKLKEQVNEINDKYLRLSAEYDNYRKRTLKEKMELTKSGGEDILINILPVVDDFERALNNLDKAKDIKAMKDGISLIYGKFIEFLKTRGIKEIEAVNKEFDTDLHEAITKIPAPDKKLKGKVVDVVEKGYFLHDKVLRYAKVVIGE